MLYIIQRRAYRFRQRRCWRAGGLETVRREGGGVVGCGNLELGRCRDGGGVRQKVGSPDALARMQYVWPTRDRPKEKSPESDPDPGPSELRRRLSQTWPCSALRESADRSIRGAAALGRTVRRKQRFQASQQAWAGLVIQPRGIDYTLCTHGLHSNSTKIAYPGSTYAQMGKSPPRRWTEQSKPSGCQLRAFPRKRMRMTKGA